MQPPIIPLLSVRIFLIVWTSRAFGGTVTPAGWCSRSGARPSSGAGLMLPCWSAGKANGHPLKSCLGLPKAILRWEILADRINAGIIAAKQAPNEWRREKLKRFGMGQLAAALRRGAAGRLGGSGLSSQGRSFQKEVPSFQKACLWNANTVLKKVECPFLHLDKYWLAMESITALFKPYENSGVTRNKKLNVSLRSDLL